ncbi:fungal hydrophobin-domain-containing protein [Trametes punicea]|nr:fungal hydrophobin-domain-containing protein [Trametes punicea]
MFARLAALSALALPLLVAAQNCNTGPVQCCNTLESANSPAGAAILGLLGVVLQDTTAQIGLQCVPIPVIGVAAGDACDSHPVCCQNNNVGGLVSIGCVPVDVI